MPGRECYHCKQWVEQGEAHDCWTTTEAALTADLSEDLRDAWERLRETAAAFGEQRIYASRHSIMFARTSCSRRGRGPDQRLDSRGLRLLRDTGAQELGEAHSHTRDQNSEGCAEATDESLVDAKERPPIVTSPAS